MTTTGHVDADLGRSIAPLAQDPENRAARQDDARMRAMYQVHGHALYRFLLHVTLGERQVAEDVMQETLLRAWQHLDELGRDINTLRPWLFTVARRIAIDAARARQARPQQIGDVDLGTMPDLDDPYERLVTTHAVRFGLGRLSQPHRDVLIQVYLRGRSVEEAAVALQIPQGTVKSRTYHALRALRRALDTTGPNEPER